MSIRIIFSMLTFLVCNVSQSQSNINQEVTLQYNNTQANIIFRDVQNQTGMVFSYSEFQDNQLMSIQVVKKPLKDVLPILETTLNIQISIKEKYIIVKPNKDGSKKELSINGTITDPNSNEPLSDASIYVKRHKILVNSDKKGRFAFNVPSSAKQVKINIAKENYLDTSVVIVATHSQTINIKMRSFPRQRISEFDSLTKKELQIGSLNYDRIPTPPEIVKTSYNENFWNKMKLKNVNLVNINDTIFNSFSVSLLPPISTNKLLSFHTRN
ncbi:MAG TPA: carboxypeptidase-like regulatory domain-containing protein, partial [Saprospiraceae bacterium]|nr:carboxypeptidase-like regulatory domain-containing protein [Saprospiraceae bacterium]